MPGITKTISLVMFGFELELNLDVNISIIHMSPRKRHDNYQVFMNLISKEYYRCAWIMTLSIKLIYKDVTEKDDVNLTVKTSDLFR